MLQQFQWLLILLTSCFLPLPLKLESLLIDAFKGKGFQKIYELLQEREVEPPQKYSESLLNQLDKALRKASAINNFNYPNTRLRAYQTNDAQYSVFL